MCSRRLLAWCLPLVLSVAWGGCGDDGTAAAGGSSGAVTDGTGVEACTPGEQQACVCEDGMAGMQSCSVSGFGPCACGDTVDDSGSTTDGPGTDSSGGATLCGNGVVDEGEQCDDGDGDDTNDCSNACVVHCGLQWESTLPDTFVPRALSRDAGGHVVALGVAGDRTSVAPALHVLDADGGEVSDATATESWEAGVSMRADVAADDSVYVFIQGTPQGEGAEVTRLYKYGLDLSLAWSVDLDPALVLDDDDVDVDAAPDGSVTLVASIDVADGDDDVWVGQFSGADGSESWTSTHSGGLDGGFSTDTGGRVVVASDGDVFVLATLRVTYNQHDSTLLRFPATGGPAELAATVIDDPGDNHTQLTSSLARNATDRIAAGVSVFTAGAVLNRHELAVYDGDTPAWTALPVDRFDLGRESMGIVDPWLGVDDDGNVMIAASHLRDIDQPGFLGIDAAIARYDARGTPTCQFMHEVADGNRAVSGAVMLDDGSLVVVGTGDVIWIGRFRP